MNFWILFYKIKTHMEEFIDQNINVKIIIVFPPRIRSLLSYLHIYIKERWTVIMIII